MDFSDARPKRSRPGKRIHLVEKYFAKLPAKHRTAEVFLVLAEACGIDREKARGHFTLHLAILGVGSAD